MRTDTRLFIGIKCMLNCTYWYFRDNNPNFDFGLGIPWSKVCDSDILNNMEKLGDYVVHANTVLTLGIGEIANMRKDDRALREGGLIDRHNGILTMAFRDTSRYTYASLPEDTNFDKIAAVIMSNGIRNLYFNDDRFDTISVRFDSTGITPRGYFGAFKSYNVLCHKMGSERQFWEYLLKQYTVGTVSDDTYAIPDSVTGEPGRNIVKDDAVESSSVYAGIKAITLNKGKAVDRYNKLVEALNKMGPKSASYLNEILLSMGDTASSDSTKKSQFDSAVKKMG